MKKAARYIPRRLFLGETVDRSQLCFRSENLVFFVLLMQLDVNDNHYHLQFKQFFT